MVTFFGMLIAALIVLFWIAVFLAGVIIVGALIAALVYLVVLVIKS